MIFDYDVCHPSLEITDPTPNIFELFKDFDRMFFGLKLSDGAVSLNWSETMKTAAGVCAYEPRSKFCHISLSQPLLLLRPRRDLVETLLHEMIHAYLFVTNNDRDRDGHGPNFKNLMNRINLLTGAKITIYHSFHDEVNHYKTTWYRCNGKCRNEKPLFGYRKGKLGRGPCIKDAWYAKHRLKCSGTYHKVSEGPTKDSINKQLNVGKNNLNSGNKQTVVNVSSIVPFSGKGALLGSTGSIADKSLVNKDKDNNNNIGKVTRTPTIHRKAKVPILDGSQTTLKSSNGQIVLSGSNKTLSQHNKTSKRKAPTDTQTSPIAVKKSKTSQDLLVKATQDGEKDNIATQTYFPDTVKSAFPGVGYALGGQSSGSQKLTTVVSQQSENTVDIADRDLAAALELSLLEQGLDRESRDIELALQESIKEKNKTVDCPSCTKSVLLSKINDHLNVCLS